MAKSAGSGANWRLRLIGIVGTSFLLRAAVAAMVIKSHPTNWFFAQTTELGLLAESLRTGHGLSSPFGGNTGPSAFLSPGYPMLVAAVFAIFGPYSHASEVVMMSLQALFGVATVFVLMVLSRRIFGVRTATIAGVILALCPPALFLPTLFWETSLSILLATMLFAAAFSCSTTSHVGQWAWMGLLAAVAVLVNPSLLPIVVCCFGWAIYQARSGRWLASGVGVALFVLLSLPWAIRNFRQLHAFIPLRSNLGYELWQGNRVGSDGFFLADLHPNVNALEFHRYESLGEIGYMREKMVAAQKQIVANRSWFVKLTAKRAYYFWGGIGRQNSSLVIGYVTTTTLLGFFGLAMLWRRNRSFAAYFIFPLLLFPLPYYLTHPDYRFRLVLDPILVALMAYAMTFRRAELPRDAETRC